MTASNPGISFIAGPGGYNAKELWRVGAPLALAYTTIVVVAVNLMF
jgi:di/tricarboxylate transporter